MPKADPCWFEDSCFVDPDFDTEDYYETLVDHVLGRGRVVARTGSSVRGAAPKIVPAVPPIHLPECELPPAPKIVPAVPPTHLPECELSPFKRFKSTREWFYHCKEIVAHK